MSRSPSYVRRGVGVVIAFGPVVLLVASLVSALTRGNEHHTSGLAVLLFALLIGALNFHLSFVRGLLYRRATGSLDGYRHVSGLPMVGTLLVVIGTLLGFGSAVCAAIGLLAIGIDTGGLVWFLIATWKDSSLWDRPA
ncbi:hypothetical protein [Labilithrix luteola]|uniref:hypothetical protein n=1 Tax=Labilithrix luteola TaxID=1391654 RepID=UPI0011BA796D|nr:hypothetical protein [Labilithrix luteola]